MRYKQGRTGSESRKYPIVRNIVLFSEPLLFDYEMPRDPCAHHPKPLRLSFRLENPSNSGFTRYGIVELDLRQYMIVGQCDQMPEGTPFPSARPSAVCEMAGESAPSSSGPSSARTAFSTGSSSSSNSTLLFETAPVKMPRERFDLLERQVDVMLAGIINAEDEKSL
jgi:hypothetical protein